MAWIDSQKEEPEERVGVKKSYMQAPTALKVSFEVSLGYTVRLSRDPENANKLPTGTWGKVEEAANSGPRLSTSRQISKDVRKALNMEAQRGLRSYGAIKQSSSNSVCLRFPISVSLSHL